MSVACVVCVCVVCVCGVCVVCVWCMCGGYGLVICKSGFEFYNITILIFTYPTPYCPQTTLLHTHLTRLTCLTRLTHLTRFTCLTRLTHLTPHTPLMPHVPRKYCVLALSYSL